MSLTRNLNIPFPIPQVVEGSDVHSKLTALLRTDLDFEASDTAYASHAVHPFAAKFPPQIPRLFIEKLTVNGDSVLDPMAGSGTTLVEALLLRREVFGFDIDPLAVRLAKVKTTWLDPLELQSAGIEIIRKAKEARAKEAQLTRRLRVRFDDATLEFLNYWFLPRTQIELLALIETIEQSTQAPLRDFLELVFSSTIIAKSGGVSLARDLAHSRPHRDLEKKPRPAVDEFSLKLGRTLRKFQNLPQRVKRVFVDQRSAKEMPLPTESIDLIVTSPPYANAIDYMRAHKFSLIWFGYSIEELGQMRAKYIGSDGGARQCIEELPPDVASGLARLCEKDAAKERVVRKYLLEMRSVLAEMYRVLKPGKASVIVVGPSVMRGIEVDTHAYLAGIGEAVGFQLAGLKRRRIDRDRRMLPISFGRSGSSAIEQRMQEEFVVGLVKPTNC